MLSKLECKFFTATILEWKHLLKKDVYKEIIMDSLRFLVSNNRIYLHAFALMDNHIHLLWSIRAPYKQEDIQRDFLKYTGQMLLKDLRNNNLALLGSFRIDAKDRKYQIWERNALTTDIWDEAALLPKLHYIHANPVKAGLCNEASEYKYSSAKYYETGWMSLGFYLIIYKSNAN